MIVLFQNIDNEHVLVFDAEYSEGYLIQFCGFLFKKIDHEIYQISKSLNIYVKLDNRTKVNPFIKDFTGITDIYLETFGVTLEEAKNEIENLISSVEDLVIVSHGLKNDRLILEDNGIDLYMLNEKVINGICTYKLSKSILDRKKNLSLFDVAEEAGVFLSKGHNAYEDAWATVSVLCLLLKLQKEKINSEKKVF